MKLVSLCSWPLLITILGGTCVLPTKGEGTNDVAQHPVLTLENSIRLALEGNPELQASRARVEASAGRRYQSKLWPNPELELNAEDWPVSGRREFSDAKQTIGLTQTLPFPGKKSLEKQMGSAAVTLSETELALRQTELVRDVKAGFYRVLTSEKLVSVATQLMTAAEASAATARKRVEAGAAAYQEQLRAEVQTEQTRTELNNFERDLATARQEFAALLGRNDLQQATFAGSLAEKADLGLLGDMTDEQVSRHPSCRGAQANLAQAKLANRRAELEPYPDVKVGLAGGRIGESGESIIQLGFTLPLPILDRGHGKQQEARANVRAAESELRAARLQLHRAWANSRERYRAAIEQVRNYRERILPKAEEAVRLVQTGFEQGKFNFIDLVDTQRTTAEARLAYQGRLLELNMGQAELEAVLQPQLTTSATSE